MGCEASLVMNKLNSMREICTVPLKNLSLVICMLLFRTYSRLQNEHIACRHIRDSCNCWWLKHYPAQSHFIASVERRLMSAVLSPGVVTLSAQHSERSKTTAVDGISLSLPSSLSKAVTTCPWCISFLNTHSCTVARLIDDWIAYLFTHQTSRGRGLSPEGLAYSTMR